MENQLNEIKKKLSINGSCGDQGNCSKIPCKLSKKQCDQIRTRGKQIIFAPATWAEELSNSLVFMLRAEHFCTIV
jgi:hypothetical protein